MSTIESKKEAEYGMPPNIPLYVVIVFDGDNQMITFDDSAAGIEGLTEWVNMCGTTDYVILKAARVEVTAKTTLALSM